MVIVSPMGYFVEEKKKKEEDFVNLII